MKRYRIRRSRRAPHRPSFRTIFEQVTGYVEVDSEPCFEGCGLGAKCESRGQRAQLQWRLGRRALDHSGFGWAWVAGAGV